MKSLFTTVAFAVGVIAACAADLAPASKPNAVLVVPDDCVWLEFSASDLTTAADIAGGIFAKHGELGRVEDLRPSIVGPTFFDESTPSSVVGGKGGVVRINGPRLPFGRMERGFSSGAVRRQALVRSLPAELFIKRTSDGSVHGLWVDRRTRFPLRFITLRPTSFDWSEFYLLNTPHPPAELFASGSSSGKPDLRALNAEEIAKARISFEALLAELPWKKDLEDLK